jgi:uncharacterized membrane protein
MPCTVLARIILLPSAALALVVGGCSQQEPTAPDPAPQEQVSIILGGVDLTQPIRALGTEPFWGVDVTADALVYSGVDRPEQRGAHSGPVIQGTTATWTTTTDQGQALELTLIDTDCSDGMSDRNYPLTARLIVGGETLNGCAALTSAVMNAGESDDLSA